MGLHGMITKENRLTSFAVSVYLFNVNNGNTRNMCQICSKLIKTPERSN